MNQRTRYFLVGSSLVMAVVLCTGLVAYYNGAIPLRASTGPEELAYIPSDVTAVAYANVRSVMDSEFRQRIREALPTGEAQDELRNEIGLDIERDIDAVVAGFSGTDPTKPGGVVVARGRFDSDLIEATARQHGGEAVDYRGKRLVLSPEMYEGEPEGSVELPKRAGVAFLESGLIAFGDEATLKRSIDAAADRQDITQNAQLMGYVAEMEIGNSAWIVSKVDEMANAAAAEVPEQFRSQMGTVEWFMAGANINGGVSGTLRAEARDEQSAEQLRDLIRGGIAALRLMTGNEPTLEPLVNSVQLSGMGNTVALQFSLTPEMIDLISGLAAMGDGGGSGGVRK